MTVWSVSSWLTDWPHTDGLTDKQMSGHGKTNGQINSVVACECRHNQVSARNTSCRLTQWGSLPYKMDMGACWKLWKEPLGKGYRDPVLLAKAPVVDLLRLDTLKEIPKPLFLFPNKYFDLSTPFPFNMGGPDRGLTNWHIKHSFCWNDVTE